MFQVPSIIEKAQTLLDNSVKLSIVTQELNPSEMAELFRLKGKPGWVMFKENPVDETDVPKEPAPEFKTDKTPSQRLRAALWVYWDANTNKKKDFATFYQEWIELKIKEIKDYLPERG